MAEVRGEVSKTGQAPPTVVIGARFGAVERVLIAGPRFVGVSRVAGDMNSNPTSVNSAWPGTAGGHEARVMYEIELRVTSTSDIVGTSVNRIGLE